VIFIIRLTPMPGTDPIRALRAALKTLKRRHGLRAISAIEETDSQILAAAGIAPVESGNSRDQRSPMS
jgi:hypothetical protein